MCLDVYGLNLCVCVGSTCILVSDRSHVPRQWTDLEATAFFPGTTLRAQLSSSSNYKITNHASHSRL